MIVTGPGARSFFNWMRGKKNLSALIRLGFSVTGSNFRIGGGSKIVNRSIAALSFEVIVVGIGPGGVVSRYVMPIRFYDRFQMPEDGRPRLADADPPSISTGRD